MKFRLKNISKNLLLTLIAIVLFTSSVLVSSDSYATASFGVGRIRACDERGEPEGLEKLSVAGSGKDADFVISNPVCLTVIATSYIAVKAAITAMNNICGSGSKYPRLTPSPFLDLIDLSKGTAKALGGNKACGAAVLTATATLTTAFTEMEVIYHIADSVYQKTSICGSNWIKPNPVTYTISTPGAKQDVANAIEAAVPEETTDTSSTGTGLSSTSTDPSSTSSESQPVLDFSNKTYREWYYDGIEVEDDTCEDPTASLVKPYPKQKYYLRGSLPGNFNCKKYDITSGQNDPVNRGIISTGRYNDFRQAYNCCKDKSRNYVCIDYGGTKKFCKAGKNCIITDNGLAVTFSAKSISNGQYICAETYSLCPYNFAVGGGSEVCDYYQDGVQNRDGTWTLITQEQIEAKPNQCAQRSVIRDGDCEMNSKAGRCKNYCQYMTHCVRTGDNDYRYESSITSPFFSNACLNFVGDSQNQTSYGTGFILGSQRHFSAPIAQCMKETLENVFYDRVGHTMCRNYGEFPSADGTCSSGQYVDDGNFVFKKGNKVHSKSFFASFQSSMVMIVKAFMTLAVIFYGLKILTGFGEINKKEMIMFIAKIGLIFYFATGEAWQTMFFDGVYGASMEFSKMVFKITTPTDPNKRDGCQFGDLLLADYSVEKATTDRSYPSGKEYLALWDTLDCKMARYLGFGPEVSVSNLAKLIFAGFFTGSIGIYFSLSVMFFGFFLIAATIRALHIFLSSLLSILLLIYVSPIIIPTVLFGRTSSIFKAWIENLISFTLQPMILFAYIAIFLSVLDSTVIGSASFKGPGPSRLINCQSFCVDSLGQKISKTVDPNCATGTLIDPSDDSVGCLINLNSFGSFPGLEIIGIGIPILKNVFTGHIKVKIITLAKAALVMYLLCKFMDEIPGISSALIGGAKLPSSDIAAMSMFKKTAGFLRGVQKRGKRVALGHGKNAAGKYGQIRDYAATRKGSKDSPSVPKEEGSDTIRGTGGVGADSAAKKEGGDKLRGGGEGEDRT